MTLRRFDVSFEGFHILRPSAVARSPYLRWSFLITQTLRLQPVDDALIAAAHTSFASVHFLVHLLT